MLLYADPELVFDRDHHPHCASTGLKELVYDHGEEEKEQTEQEKPHGEVE